MRTECKSFAGRPFVVVDPRSLGMSHTTSTFDDHEPMLRELESVKPGQFFVDVGACVGSYALPALAMGARVLAFEPSDESVEILRENVAANGWLVRSDIRPVILSDGSPLPEPWADEIFGKHYPATTRATATLDDVLRGQRLDWLKLDVEGLEWHVLRGAAEAIARWKPTMLIEDHDGINPGVGCQVSDYPASIDSARRIHEMLASLGYQIEVRPWDVSRKFIVARPS